ncbi:conserved hypothetical protein [Culex quinquefasciatus]|uniref:Uncharacterized protein n=1 Tax=Culex quinquefasciatus TaxID=7176 RepID=B0X2R3_CULQU|nr:conserved hypothetical protein [Culex quinquefasciatus]|eukprot:XP_001863935.1 conserved hypothetical protein [Culex quinquefasciatus]
MTGKKTQGKHKEETQENTARKTKQVNTRRKHKIIQEGNTRRKHKETQENTRKHEETQRNTRIHHRETKKNYKPLIVNVSQCVYSQVYICTAEKKKRGGKKVVLVDERTGLSDREF